MCDLLFYLWISAIDLEKLNSQMMEDVTQLFRKQILLKNFNLTKEFDLDIEGSIEIN